VAKYDVFPAFCAKIRLLLYNPLGVLILAALVALLCGLYFTRKASPCWVDCSWSSFSE
jgi:hypothetical protein